MSIRPLPEDILALDLGGEVQTTAPAHRIEKDGLIIESRYTSPDLGPAPEYGVIRVLHEKDCPR